MPDQRPAPLTPADCDISDWPGMMLDVARLQKSRAWLICKREPHLAFYMLNLWFGAWHAVPAASLEDDDDVLADIARSPSVEHWREIKDDVMRGFTLCSDGRWYHEVIAVKALEAWISKLGSRISSGAGNASRWKGEFDEQPLKARLQVAKDLLQALDPTSKVFARSRAGVTKTTPEKPARAPRKPRAAAPEAAPAGGSADRIPPGDDRDADEIAREEKGSEGKGREGTSVGGTPPTTPGAGAPADQGGKPSTTIVMADRNLVLPEWLVPHAEAWAAFEQIRWKKNAKAPYTLAAQKGIVKKLEKLLAEGQDLTAVLTASVNAGWTDVYAQKVVGPRAAPAAGSRYAGAAAAVFGTRGPRQEVIDVEAR